MPEEKKKADRSGEIGDEELDKVSGGIPQVDSAHYYGMGNNHFMSKCWWCNKIFDYSPGIVPVDNWNRNFCCVEHWEAYEKENGPQERPDN